MDSERYQQPDLNVDINPLVVIRSLIAVSLNPKCVSLNPKRFSNHKNLGAAVPFKGIALLVALWIGLDSVLGHRCNFSV